MLVSLSLGLLLVAGQTAAPAPAPTAPAPARCRAFLEDMGKVGLRISDAQALAQDTLTVLRQRLGQEGAAYEGLLKSHLDIKRRLGPGAEHQIQDEQIAWLQACAESAPFRVRVRFGKKKGRHFIALSCRNKDAPASRPLEEKRFEAKTFADARAKMNEALPGFCRLMDPSAAAPAPERKPKKQWTLPPRRE